MLRRTHTLAALAALLTLTAGIVAAAEIPAYVTVAVGDARRPDVDKVRDADRKPAETVAFMGLKPDDKIVDYWSNDGYFDPIFSKVVGAKGHVYNMVPDEIVKRVPTANDHMKAIIADPQFSNISIVVQPMAAFKIPEPVDVVWIRQNYHDLGLKFVGGNDVAAFNKAVFAGLKPGGVYIILDHAAAADADADVSEKLHRIREDQVKKEVEAAGFKLDGESSLLRNPGDDHSKQMRDPAIRGKTDQFILRFRKPK